MCLRAWAKPRTAALQSCLRNCGRVDVGLTADLLRESLAHRMPFLGRDGRKAETGRIRVQTWRQRRRERTTADLVKLQRSYGAGRHYNLLGIEGTSRCATTAYNSEEDLRCQLRAIQIGRCSPFGASGRPASEPETRKPNIRTPSRDATLKRFLDDVCSQLTSKRDSAGTCGPAA